MEESIYVSYGREVEEDIYGKTREDGKMLLYLYAVAITIYPTICALCTKNRERRASTNSRRFKNSKPLWYHGTRGDVVRSGPISHTSGTFSSLHRYHRIKTISSIPLHHTSNIAIPCLKFLNPSLST